MEGLGSILLFVLPLLLLFMIMSRARRQQRAVLEAQAAVRPGTRIVTTAGLHATVVEVEGDVVVLETGPGQQSRWARAAVGRILPEEPAAQASEPATAAERPTDEDPPAPA